MDASKLIGYDGIFATRLRALMKSAKATQQDVAAAVGTTRQAISQYADGSVQPNIEKLYKIAEYFNVSADYLLGFADVTTSNVDDKAINKILGLSEKSIDRLKDEVDWAREETNMDTNYAICEFDKKIHMSIISVINLLLEEPHRKNDDNILAQIGDIFARDATLFPSPKSIVVDDECVRILNGILSSEEILAIRLLNLQQAIRRYKSEIDKKPAGNDNK